MKLCYVYHLYNTVLYYENTKGSPYITLRQEKTAMKIKKEITTKFVH